MKLLFYYNCLRWLVLVFVIQTLIPPLSAQIIWNGTRDTSWYNEQDTVFILTTAEQFAGFSTLVYNRNDFTGKTVKLATDLYLNDTTDWENWEMNPPANIWYPIGWSNSTFDGNFDGGNHVIYGVYTKPTRISTGLFGSCSSSTIKNISVAQSYIQGTEHVGGIAGSMTSYYTYGDNITNCHFSGNIVAQSTKNILYGITAGGLVGDISNITISNCSSSGSVSARSAEKYIYVGGLMGSSSGVIKISDSHSTSSVFAETVTAELAIIYAGGLIGEGCNVVNCYATGDVIAQDVVASILAGGLIGKGSGIVNCYATGDVTVRDVESVREGGLIGEIYGSYGNNADLSNCYSTGQVLVENVKYIRRGNFLGFNLFNAKLSNAFYRKESDPLADPILGATPLSISELKSLDLAYSLDTFVTRYNAGLKEGNLLLKHWGRDEDGINQGFPIHKRPQQTKEHVYAIEYFYDGILAADSTLTGTRLSGETLTYQPKPRPGYELDYMNPVSGEIIIGLTGNTIKVYYKSATNLEEREHPSVTIAIINNQLQINSPFMEFISIYDLKGHLLHQEKKEIGEFKIQLNLTPQIWIVHGDSGWIKKVTPRLF